MRLKHFFLYTLLSTLTWTVAGGCRKDVEEFRPYPVTLEEIALLLGKVPDPSTSTVFNMSGAIADTTLRTGGGVRVLLSDTETLFEDEQGNPVPCSTCQDLRIEVTEALTKGDLLARGLGTSDVENQLFQSAGAVRVKFQCSGKTLKLQKERYVKVQVPASNPKNDWTLYSYPSTPTTTTWINTTDPAYMADWADPGGAVVQGYELLMKTSGWVSAGQKLTAGTGSICANLPPNLNPQNAVVYIVLKKTHAVIALKEGLNAESFCALNLPAGEPIRLIAVSKFGDAFQAGVLEDETGGQAAVKSLSPQTRTEQEILTLLRGL